MARREVTGGQPEMLGDSEAQEGRREDAQAPVLSLSSLSFSSSFVLLSVPYVDTVVDARGKLGEEGKVYDGME